MKALAIVAGITIPVFYIGGPWAIAGLWLLMFVAACFRYRQRHRRSGLKLFYPKTIARDYVPGRYSDRE